MQDEKVLDICCTATATAKSLQSCLTLCDPTDGSPPGSPVPGILQARTLEWVSISFSNAGKRKMKGKSLSRVRLSVTPWTVAYQAPPSMGFSKQEYWSGVPLPSPEEISSLSHSVVKCQRFQKWNCWIKQGPFPVRYTKPKGSPRRPWLLPPAPAWLLTPVPSILFSWEHCFCLRAIYTSLFSYCLFISFVVFLLGLSSQ